MRPSVLSTKRLNSLGLAVFLVCTLLPLAAGLAYALAYSFGLAGALSHGFTREHWMAVLDARETWFSLVLSAGIAFTVVILATFLAMSMVLYWGARLERGLPGYLIYLPLAVPPLTAAFLTFQLLGKSGLLARAGVALGLLSGIEQAPEWINDPWHIGVVITLVALTAPFFTVLFLQYRRAENLPQLMQVARTLGASEKQNVWRVAAPVLLRRALPNLGLSAIFLFGAYEAPLLLGRQSPRMISVLIAQKFRKFNLADVPQAYALTLLYAIAVVIAAWWLFHKMKRISGAVNTLILLLSVGMLHAQGPLDGYLKGKGNLDIAVSFSGNSSNIYHGGKGEVYDLTYRGSLLSVFAEYGLTDNFDVVGVGSYVFTPTQDGLQDGGLFAKYRFWKGEIAENFRLHAIGGLGLAFPLSDYEPTANGALGTKAVAAPARLILQLETPPGLFVNVMGGYNWRFDEASDEDVAAVQMERPDFQPVSPANYVTFLAKIGFPAAHYYLDAWFEWQYTKGGSDYVPDIPDLPQLYGVSYRQIGGTAYYSDEGKMGYYISSGYILNGRNVSQMLRITGGLVFKINTIKK
jgi:putative spermidine/putrescine transport system permease protein